jgi:hypothetical protein
MSGNESSGQDLRSRRPSLAVNYMAHVADSQRFLLQGSLFSKTSARAVAKSGGLRFRSELSAVLASRRGGCQDWRFPTREAFVMHNRIDIDPKHSRAIVQEVGERLRAVLKEEPECPGSLRTQIDRLRELEEQSPIIVPAAEHWDKRRR